MAKKFNFETACAALLTELGAVPVEDYHRQQYALNTKAGRLLCTPYDNWLACRFDDVKAAVKTIGSGNLNPFSGKWNWHYTKPQQAELDHLKSKLVEVLV